MYNTKVMTLISKFSHLYSKVIIFYFYFFQRLGKTDVGSIWAFAAIIKNVYAVSAEQIKILQRLISPNLYTKQPLIRAGLRCVQRFRSCVNAAMVGRYCTHGTVVLEKASVSYQAAPRGSTVRPSLRAVSASALHCGNQRCVLYAFNRVTLTVKPKTVAAKMSVRSNLAFNALALRVLSLVKVQHMVWVYRGRSFTARGVVEIVTHCDNGMFYGLRNVFISWLM